MGRYSGIPELLEQFMNENEADERWITVHDLRDRFNLTRYQCNTVSGFLRRLKFRTFGRHQFIVIIALLTLAALAISVIALIFGWLTIFQNLYYFPIFSRVSTS
jgi:hypothetical protein